jgi:prepilin-type N-terminal cleavage/methylation domain-containing protein
MGNQGFTLVEIIIATAIIILTVSLGLSVSLSSYRASIFREDLRLVTTLLVEARTQAMQNRDAASHGVRIEPSQAISFTGSHYTTGSISNRSFPMNLRLEDRDAEIIFQPLSGSLFQPLSLTLTNGITSKTININTEGVIDD